MTSTMAEQTTGDVVAAQSDATDITFADWLYARCGTVRRYQRPVVLDTGAQIAAKYWLEKMAKMREGGK